MSANKEGKKPHYKDYVNFLDSYRNGKRDESVCHSLTNSSNNSSTSINSDHQGDSATRGFKEYLENYENKKFSSVKPTFTKNNTAAQNKIVKTEIFININNEQNSVSNNLKKFENSNGTNDSTNQVGKVTKIFEKKSNGETITKTASSKVNKFQSQHSETENNINDEKHISVEEISKKFQANNGNNYSTLEKRITLNKKDSIKEKSKIFESKVNDTKNKTNGFKGSSQICKQSVEKPKLPLPPKPLDIKTGVIISPKSPENSVANGSLSPTNFITRKEDIPKLVEQTVTQSESTSLFTSPSTCVVSPSNIPPPPPIPGNNGSLKSSNFSPPPPPPFVPVQEISKLVITPSVKSTPQQTSSINIPIPPPPPPSNFSIKATSASFTNHSNKTQMNGYNTLPKMQTNKQEDGVDGIPVPTLDKNDPRVKKLVYGALRNMCGAYHGQANDYIATLPKNRVRKNNGLDSIIDNIASQGGLEKLSGRANPKIETELSIN